MNNGRGGRGEKERILTQSNPWNRGLPGTRQRIVGDAKADEKVCNVTDLVAGENPAPPDPIYYERNKQLVYL